MTNKSNISLSIKIVWPGWLSKKLKYICKMLLATSNSSWYIRVFGITKYMNCFIYIIKMCSKSIMRCILVNGSGRNKKSTLFKPSLYLS